MSETIPETKHHPHPELRRRGDGNIFQRKNIWWIRYSRRGKPIRESSHSSDPEVARKLLNRRTKELWAEKKGLQPFLGPKAEKVLVSQLLDSLMADYKLKGTRSLKSIKAHSKPIREAFGDMRAVDVTTAHMDRYINRRLKEDERAPATVNREIHVLARAFRLGVERREILPGPHIRRLAENNTRQGFFTRAEFESVVAALPEYLQDFTRFAYLCAWRKGQTAALKWEHVSRTDGVIIAPGEIVKNKRPHKIVLEGELTAIIERAWEARQYEASSGPAVSEYVFHHDGEPIRDPRKAWAAACGAAGLMKPKLDKKGNPVTELVDGKRRPVMIPARLFHDLRRSGVRNLIRAGVSETVAMRISGHKTRAVFDRYNITSDDDLREAVRQTQEYLKAQPAVSNVVAIGKR
jgi:integrase